jgi:hypothetical protein
MKRGSMNNVIQFPAVGTYTYNAQRLHNYAGSMMKQKMWEQFDVVMAISELYDNDLVDIDWDPATGEPIVVKKDLVEETD